MIVFKRIRQKVILDGGCAKHSATSLEVAICKFCLSCFASHSGLGHSFFSHVSTISEYGVYIWKIEEFTFPFYSRTAYNEVVYH